MAKAKWYLVALSLLATAFLYEPETRTRNFKRSPTPYSRHEKPKYHNTRGKCPNNKYCIVQHNVPCEHDYQELYDLILEHIESSEIDLRPKFVRAVFHDLMNFEDGSFGAEGCIFMSEDMSNFKENFV